MEHVLAQLLVGTMGRRMGGEEEEEEISWEEGGRGGSAGEGGENGREGRDGGGVIFATLGATSQTLGHKKNSADAGATLMRAPSQNKKTQERGTQPAQTSRIRKREPNTKRRLQLCFKVP